MEKGRVMPTQEDNQILKLESKLLRKCKLSLLDQGLAPWAKMETELYSVGRCLREISGYSRFFPIFLSGDHGVVFSNTRFWASERDNIYSAYLTSSSRKYELLKNKYNANVIHIKHPWIAWLEHNKITKSAMGRGVLVFLPHSSVGVRYTAESFKKYLHQVKRISKEYGEITLCISYYDITSVNLKLIYDLGFKVTTAGNPRSINFVKNFYDLIDNFEYATSPNVGSHVFYCLNFGIKFFLYGEIEWISTGLGQTSKGSIRPEDYSESPGEINEYYRFVEEIRFPNIGPTRFTDLISSQVLGLTSATNNYELKKILNSQLKTFWWHYFILLKKYFNLLIRKIVRNF